MSISVCFLCRFIYSDINIIKCNNVLCKRELCLKCLKIHVCMETNEYDVYNNNIIYDNFPNISIKEAKILNVWLGEYNNDTPQIIKVLKELCEYNNKYFKFNFFEKSLNNDPTYNYIILMRLSSSHKRTFAIKYFAYDLVRLTCPTDINVLWKQIKQMKQWNMIYVVEKIKMDVPNINTNMILCPEFINKQIQINVYNKNKILSNYYDILLNIINVYPLVVYNKKQKFPIYFCLNKYGISLKLSDSCIFRKKIESFTDVQWGHLIKKYDYYNNILSEFNKNYLKSLIIIIMYLEHKKIKLPFVLWKLILKTYFRVPNIDYNQISYLFIHKIWF